jgi:hypothetical protein
MYKNIDLATPSVLTPEEEEALREQMEALEPSGQWRLIYEIPYKLAGMERWDEAYLIASVLHTLRMARTPLETWCFRDDSPFLAASFVPPAWLLIAKESLLDPPATLRALLFCETKMRLLRATFCVERWRTAHGALPAKREEITDEATIWPDDVLDNAPLRYRRAAPGYCVYSAGINGTDDGGIPQGKSWLCEDDFILAIPRG